MKGINTSIHFNINFTLQLWNSPTACNKHIVKYIYGIFLNRLDGSVFLLGA